MRTSVRVQPRCWVEGEPQACLHFRASGCRPFCDKGLGFRVPGPGFTLNVKPFLLFDGPVNPELGVLKGSWLGSAAKALNLKVPGAGYCNRENKAASAGFVCPPPPPPDVVKHSALSLNQPSRSPSSG